MLTAQVYPRPAIVLTTLNAKFIHASLGLRYLLANMGDLRPFTILREFTIARPVEEIVEELLANLDTYPDQGAKIIGFGVYIWNVRQTEAVIRRFRLLRPDVRIVLGGPEVSYELDEQEIVALADHVITGWGDVSFAALCRDLVAGSGSFLPKVIVGEQPPLDRIALPYAEYSDADLAHRLVYVEASRGCPFKCEFCLSALDRTAWGFEPEHFLAEMRILYERGARHFKFVDRTFNLKIENAVRILEFFLERLNARGESGDLFLHFEIVPDHLPERLREVVALFPPGVLQFEIGIQSFNPDVQQRISRRQDMARSEGNLRWLVEESNAHIHADLIFGLPGETLESFAHGFDRLYARKPHEIQMGLLKRLRGTTVIRHTKEYGLVFDSEPPYAVRETGAVGPEVIERFVRLARYWDRIANSGRFKATLPLLMGKNQNLNPPFYAFFAYCDWFWARIGKTCFLSPELLTDALFDYLVERGLPRSQVQDALLADYMASGARGSPQSLKGRLPKREIRRRDLQRLANRQAAHGVPVTVR